MYQSWILPNAQITIGIMFLFNSTPFAHTDVLKQETLCRFKKSLILDKKKKPIKLDTVTTKSLLQLCHSEPSLH